MKRIFTLILFLMLVLSKLSFGQSVDFSDKIPYQVKDRIALADSVKNINLRDYHLCDYGDSIIVFTQEKKKREIIFYFQIYAKNGTKGRLLSIPLQKQERNYLQKRWEVRNIVFSNDNLYLLFSYQLWVLPFTEKKNAYFGITSFSQPYDLISNTKEGLFLQRFGIKHGFVEVKDKVTLVKLALKDNEYIEEVIDAYTPENYFLMLFESRKYYDIDPSGKFIVKLYNDKPEFDILDFEGNVILTHKMDVPWKYFEADEIKSLNKKADRDPNAVFSALQDRFFYEVFVNARVDFIDSGKFLISQILHRPFEDNPDSLDLNQEARLYELFNNEVKYVKSYPAGSYLSQNDGRFFPFYNSNERNFFFKNNNRYQLGVFPYFDATLTDESEIRQQQKESFLSNRFQLCLYIGELRP